MLKLLHALILTLIVVCLVNFSSSAQSCSTPGKDGVLGGTTSIINTYHPGTASVTAGTTTRSIALGTATGSTTPIAVGDLVLIIQMQGADINVVNSAVYGATSNVTAGTYEYAIATSAVPITGGTLSVSKLQHSYTAAASATQGQRSFQVIRVPQYSTLIWAQPLPARPGMVLPEG